MQLSMGTKATEIDTYISGFPEATRKKLRELRECIRKAAPAAEEAIRYGIPTFILHGNLVHFAAFKHHVGFYATPTAHENFAAQLAKYTQGKGSVQFPLSEPLPLALISRMVKFRVKENIQKQKEKQLSKKSSARTKA